ncbi:MAG TPA: MlaD family protein [Planctomycetota bacterium]|nr:MlaD family protein [Planctomycetota bacterium]
MAVKATEVRSGIFVVLALVVLTILIFSVGNFRQRLQATHVYSSFIPDAKFLKPHDPVTYGGHRVGEVKSVEVSSERFGLVKVILDVQRDVVVKEDSILVLKQDGMLGTKYMEITPGTPAARRVDAGSEIKGIVPPAITDLAAAMERPLGKIDRILEHLDAILGKPESQKNIADILSDAKALLATMDAQMKKIGDLAAGTGEKAGKVLDELQATVKDVRAPLASTLKNADELTGKVGKSLDELVAKLSKALDEMTAKLTRTADGLDRLLRDADGLVLENATNIFETIRGLRDTAYHLELTAKRVRADPSVLLFGAEETAEERRRADETELRLKGRARRYDKEDPK